MAPQLNDVVIAPTSENDLLEMKRLHARIFGPGRFARTAYRIREGHPLISRFCHTAKLNGRLVASVTLTPVIIGNKADALLLGPLAVSSAHANIGIGRKLIKKSLAAAKAEGIRLVVLVGELAYYKRVGFTRVPYGHITFPGPADPMRILSCALDNTALDDYRGLIRAVKHND